MKRVASIVLLLSIHVAYSHKPTKFSDVFIVSPELNFLQAKLKLESNENVLIVPSKSTQIVDKDTVNRSEYRSDMISFITKDFGFNINFENDSIEFIIGVKKFGAEYEKEARTFYDSLSDKIDDFYKFNVPTTKALGEYISSTEGKLFFKKPFPELYHSLNKEYKTMYHTKQDRISLELVHFQSPKAEGYNIELIYYSRNLKGQQINSLGK